MALDCCLLERVRYGGASSSEQAQRSKNRNKPVAGKSKGRQGKQDEAERTGPQWPGGPDTQCENPAE